MRGRRQWAKPTLGRPCNGHIGPIVLRELLGRSRWPVCRRRTLTVLMALQNHGLHPAQVGHEFGSRLRRFQLCRQSAEPVPVRPGTGHALGRQLACRWQWLGVEHSDEVLQLRWGTEHKFVLVELKAQEPETHVWRGIWCLRLEVARCIGHRMVNPKGQRGISPIGLVRKVKPCVHGVCGLMVFTLLEHRALRVGYAIRQRCGSEKQSIRSVP
jgi:hypothetical protein